LGHTESLSDAAALWRVEEEWQAKSPSAGPLILQRYLTAEIAETAEKAEAWVTTNSSQQLTPSLFVFTQFVPFSASASAARRAFSALSPCKKGALWAALKNTA
jgi:hypothetical protein